jgi:hypothetical protein
MTAKQWFDRWVLGKKPPRVDTTRALIAESEKARRELFQITERLIRHVTELRAAALALSRDNEEGRTGG